MSQGPPLWSRTNTREPKPRGANSLSFPQTDGIGLTTQTTPPEYFLALMLTALYILTLYGIMALICLFFVCLTCCVNAVPYLAANQSPLWAPIKFYLTWYDEQNIFIAIYLFFYCQSVMTLPQVAPRKLVSGCHLHQTIKIFCSKVTTFCSAE